MGMDAPRYEDTHNTLWAPGPSKARPRRVLLNQPAYPGKTGIPCVEASATPRLSRSSTRANYRLR